MDSNLREQIHPFSILIVLSVIGVASYFEFVYYPETNIYIIVVWIIVVPLLLLATIDGFRNHPMFRFFSYLSFIIVATLQYMGGGELYIAALFAVAGSIGIFYMIWNIAMCNTILE